MSKITFELVHGTSDVVVKTFNSLRDCIIYIRLELNDARKYIVNELENNEMTKTCSAYYLLENYKDLNNLPISLSDM